MSLSFFFFQAEDGIRDLTVTGVQTCALPISPPRCGAPRAAAWYHRRRGGRTRTRPRLRERGRPGAAGAGRDCRGWARAPRGGGGLPGGGGAPARGAPPHPRAATRDGGRTEHGGAYPAPTC